jgi:hypothetical protein
MRDRGHHFFWKDLYASNNFARGFEYDPQQRYGLLTAFEVLEHFVDPMSELEGLMAEADHVFVSTLTVPEPAPKLSDWWYYVPSTGQHVSFYTAKALQYIATRFGRHLYSTGSYHLFTTSPVSSVRFRLAMNDRCSKVISYLGRRPSLIQQDFDQLVGRPSS